MKKILITVIAILIILTFAVGCNNSKQTNDSDSIVNIFFEQKDKWDMLESDYGGHYDTGFYFIDIDNDGEKELAVQYGGGSSGNCETIIYKINNGNIMEYCMSSEVLSLSVESLTKYKDKDGNIFYLNEYTIGDDFNTYVSNLERIFISENKIMADVLLNCKTMYDEDDVFMTSPTYEYYILDNETNTLVLTNYNDYYTFGINYISELERLDFTYKIITKSVWDGLSDTEKLDMLKSSYEA